MALRWHVLRNRNGQGQDCQLLEPEDMGAIKWRYSLLFANLVASSEHRLGHKTFIGFCHGTSREILKVLDGSRKVQSAEVVRMYASL